jgi:predicted ester cyclase
VDDLVIDAETGAVAVRWSATGTHHRQYLGAEPSGRLTRFKGIEIIRIANDRIVERWGEWDGIYLLQQLGLVDV